MAQHEVTVFALAVFLMQLFWSPFCDAQSLEESIVHDGIKRTYHVHRPPGDAGSAAAFPLVLLFHGGTGDGVGVERISGMDFAADAHHFIVVYPDGVDKKWNDGRQMAGANADDVGFIGELIEHLSHEYKIDAKRIYACGISNGGFFSQRLACSLPDKIAAVSSVAASVAVGEVCSVKATIPIMFFLGDSDPLVPYAGGYIRGLFGGKRGSVLSATDAVRFWVNHNHCAPQPTASFGKKVGNCLGFDCKGYSSSSTPNCVVCYTVHGGGHTWPGGRQYLPIPIVGRAVDFLNANEIMWQFFAGHPLK